TSSIPSFEILNNSSINSIESIGQIGSINGLVGYPQGAITITDIIIPERRTPAIINGNLFGWHKEKAYTQNMQHINPGEEYILSCKGVIDPELTYLVNANIGGKMNRHINLHFHAGVMLPESTTLDTPPNKMFSLMATSFSCVAAAMGENWVVTSTGLDNQESYQFSGDFIIKNFMDSEGNITFKVELTQHLGNDASTSAADITNTKATYQISAYRKG
ncbi:MAG: hypothetical protein K2N45_05015, partial [Helicobacter japonicus]|nr:hypothetical protein [Helicobacter japonicus]